MKQQRVTIGDEAAMLHFGAALAAQLAPGDWVAINGPLGAGKTVLCKAIIRHFGYQGEVASPSYALVHHYGAPDVSVPIVHADLYRISDSDDLEELGLDDGRDDCITLVEWAEKSGGYYGDADYELTIVPEENGRRTVDMFRRK
ncbi:tRNA (adenosine(37)-N6)-threonylcarbamoyltransferase complex ATPase subunit type 1 TsaE [Sphingorhabdus arenilitoris]|uniref:tRNA threonylcarbamoyladenosine biosynthesis protein TsaE n=1 Tax=Sphingorhabdus arenilitoris TaxID=1490041 RepID=A0ABV8RF21_9SPHN